MLPRDIVEAAGIDLGLRAGKRAAELDDLGEGRLRIMDDAGIDVQVLSALGYFVQDLEPAAVRPMEPRAQRPPGERPSPSIPIGSGHSPSLPMTDPAAAVDELTRCVEELGFVGAMIHGQTNGVFLDHPSMRPILAAAARLDVPIYLHPAPPPPVEHEAYYSGLSPEISACLSTSGWGWHAECGMHVLRMVAAGVFEELPDLKIIVGHMGEGLPFHLDRIESMLDPVVHRALAERRRDPASQPVPDDVRLQLRCAAAVRAVRLRRRSHHVLGRPPVRRQREGDRLPALGAGEAGDREKIAHGNAESLLRI